MKINNIGSSGINPYKRQMNKIDTAQKAVNNASDKLEISATAKEMQQLSQVVQQRQARVEELKDQVQAGTYQVKPEEVAKSIVNFFSKN